MRKTYRYRLKPTKAQEVLLVKTLSLCCDLYNAALMQRRFFWQQRGISATYVGQANQLSELKSVFPEFALVHSQVLQSTLKRLDRAYDNFFRRVKASQKPGFPRYRSKSRFDSFTYPQGGWKLEGNRIKLSKIGPVQIRLHRPIVGDIKTVSIRRENDQWYVCFSCELPNMAKRPIETEIGIDMGLTSFATLSTNETVANSRYFKKAQAELRRKQRRLSRRVRGSANRNKARKQVAKAHLKIRRQRRDFAFKVAKSLVDRFDAIAVEDLRIANMVQNPHLAKSISDAGWGQFLDILAFKAEEAGAHIEFVNSSGTSQVCSSCGTIVPKTLDVRWHECDCGASLDRDHNAALNILRLGQSRWALT